MSRSSTTALLALLTLVGLSAHEPVLAAAPAAAPAPAAPAAPPPIPKAPDVNARAYMLSDFQSGRVLAQDHADDRMEPASLTKLMTAYVVFTALKENRLKLADQVTISEHAWRAEGSRTFVQVGTQIPVDILIKGMIIQSGNDATIALAERVGGTEPAFAQIMNEYAKRLGMNGSHFENSDGLPSPNHYTTPHDMTMLAKAIIRDFPEYYPLFSMHEFLWNNIKQQNRNGLLERDPTVDGLKTGHTDSAGFCLVTSAKRDGMRLISVVMGSPSVKAREDASAALLNYGYTFYETTKLKSARDAVLKPHVFKGENDYVTVGVPSDIVVTIGRGQATTLTTTAKLTKEPLIAPLTAGQALGELTVTDSAGQVVARSPLVALVADPAGGLWTRASDSIRLWFH